MAETQSLDKKIAAEMAKIANLETLRRALNVAKTEDERDHYQDLAYATLASDLKRDEVFEEKAGVLAHELDINPYRRIKQSLASRLESIEEDYKANLALIQEAIEAKLNKELAGIDTSKEGAKAKATDAIVFYFANALELELPEQADLDRRIVASVEAETGIQVTGNYAGIGNPERARQTAYRLTAADYLSEEKDKEGKVTGYAIDSKKLNKLLENPIAGSILYHAKKPKKEKKE